MKEKDKEIIVDNPVKFPYFNDIKEVQEPYMKIKITTPSETLSDVMKLVEQNMGEMMDMGNEDKLVKLIYKIPLSKIAHNFFNNLKSVSHGYANFDTEFLDYEVSDLVKIEVDLNYAPVDTLGFIVHRQDAARISS